MVLSHVTRLSPISSLKKKSQKIWKGPGLHVSGLSPPETLAAPGHFQRAQQELGP